MEVPADEQWLDGEAGQLVRPYIVTNGRTQHNTKLDLMSMMLTTGLIPHLSQEYPEHAEALNLCNNPLPVVEVAARLKRPVIVTKVILSELIEWGAVASLTSHFPTTSPADRETLEAILDGLHRL